MPSEQKHTEIKIRLLDALKRSDERSRDGRANRIIWLSAYKTDHGAIIGPSDTMAIQNEANQCFVDGQYIATVLLVMAFFEHSLIDELLEKEIIKAGQRCSLEKAIKLAKEYSVLDSDLLNSADQLRLIRNPLSHRKDPKHEHNFGNRYIRGKIHPQTMLEKDAKDAIMLMYRVFDDTLRSWGDPT